MRKKVLIGLLAGCAVAGLALARPVPKRLVMLTFDDAALIYATYVAPLQEYGFGFGATLFVYGLRQPAFADRSLYMGWAQIRALVRQGFEVDRHPLLHRHETQLTGGGLVVKLDLMGSRCRAWSIRWPATVAYPGYDTVARAWPGLWARGYRLAHAGGSRRYRPAQDDPLAVPSYATLAANHTQILAALAVARVPTTTA